MRPWVVEPTLWFMATPRVMASVLRLLAPLSLSTQSSLPLMLREALETHMSLSWLLSPLDLQYSWFTWPLSPSQELASTRPGVLEPPSSSTEIRHGMTIGSFGLDLSLELLLLLCTTR
uniref:Plasma membrane aquaporin 1 n=1 Tax=Rhizophora mucronata TaxID=61149 RepID=A0A2P2LJ25_RHIMU